MYKIMLSAGEASGDMHGASVATALLAIAPDTVLFGMGGTAMRSVGVRILYDIADYGVMGFAEVVKNLPRLFQLRDDLVAAMKREKPDVLVIIDYPDFNMRLAQCAKKLGIPVFSYIPPSAWAWRKGRAKSVSELADKIAAIFPFEADVYKRAGGDVAFVGHPLLDIVKPTMDKAAAYDHFGVDPKAPLVLLLPGSRKQEVAMLLPIMLEAAEKIVEQKPNCRFFLPAASTISEEILENVIGRYKVSVCVAENRTYDLMQIADLAIAASGTVTLEAAIMDLPSVVVYKMAPLTYYIGKLLIKIPTFSLPNIIAGRRVLPELLQAQVTAENITVESLRLLEHSPYAEGVREELGNIREKLGAGGAVQRVAALILATADKSTEMTEGRNEQL